MGRTHLSIGTNRNNWQKKTSRSVTNAENISQILITLFKNQNYGNRYCLEEKPNDFKNAYNRNKDRCGFVPDFVIRDKVSGKSAYFEVKRQANSGNAQERSCKYLTPAMQTLIKTESKTSNGMFFIYLEALADTNTKYWDELHFHHSHAPDHVLYWNRKASSLINFFDTVVRSELK